MTAAAPVGRAAAGHHVGKIDDLLTRLDVDPSTGLSDAEAAQRLSSDGPNELTSTGRTRWPALLLAQFTDVMIVILLAAAVLSAVLGDVVDTAVIIVIVVLNATIGFTQAMRADKALAALQHLAAARAQVVRQGRVKRVNAAELVVGDIVLIEAGNHVTADLRLLDETQLEIDESALTGESQPVEKQVETLTEADLSLGDRTNLAHKGTTVTRGHGRGVVVATGMRTELGKIADLLDKEVGRSTPLQQRLTRFGHRIAVIILVICLGLFVLGWLQGESVVVMALTSISLAVAAIPEALPAVVTVLLAVGARRMANFQALIRQLPSVETLGSVSYICTDKTGTLTRNQMRVEVVSTAAGDQALDHHPPEQDEAVARVLLAAALCNDAAVDDDEDSSDDWRGEPTETALVEAAARAGMHKPDLDQQYRRLAELPFDSGRKRMTTLHETHDGTVVGFTKGAPERVVGRCTAQWTPTGTAPFDEDEVMARAEALAQQGYRVLALAQREHADLPGGGDVEALDDSVETDLALIGLVSLLDPPRDEAQAAVADCLTAGITPVMITGDHAVTAATIAQRLGITDDVSQVMTGQDLAAIDDDELAAQVDGVRVYARVDPAQKIRIVEALQGRGQFVAMTGDGVNDAPALKRADIGVAMGRGGTDVAREASSLVLLDDNFATIVAAVREGRRIYDNIRKFVRYAMTGNTAEILTLVLAPLLGLPLPLLPVHILWINLVTDGLPGLALAAEPAEPGVMRRPPRPPKESLFAHGMAWHIVLVGALLAAECLAIQAWSLHSATDAHWQTMVFTTLTLGQMAHVLAIRSEIQALWQQRWSSNRPLWAAVLLTTALQMATIYVPWLNPIFHTAPLTLAELGICAAAAVVVWLAVEAEKGWRRHRQVALGTPELAR